jgi:superfamily II DNA or RNA helicase
MKITQLDAVHCRADKKATRLLRPFLSYKAEFWKMGEYNYRVRKEKTEYLIDTDGLFLSGYLPRVIKFLSDTDVLYKNIFHYDLKGTPNVPGITLRPDQKKLIKDALAHGRGVLKAPTAVGKTIIAAGLISCFPDFKILFLCHTKTLVNQTMEEFTKYLYPKFSISKCSEGIKDLSGKIVISTIQSFSRLHMDEYCDLFDMIIVDECHHCNGGQYEYVLTRSLAPIRIGLTATLPSIEEKKLKLEGLLGPVIGELTMEEGKEKNLLAKPKIKLVKVPKCPGIRELKRYGTTIDVETKIKTKGIYETAVVSYRTRNKMVIDEIKKQNEIGKSTLTYVNQIDHGDRLLKMAESYGVELIMVQGTTEGDVRSKLRKELQEKKILNLVATTVFKEGVNIPSLNTIILASGGKSELALLQTIGRGLRKDIGKDEVLIIDFVDSGKYLSEHFCERLSVYLENGWI